MKRIVIGITGATGAIYGIRFMQLLKKKAEIHLVASRASWGVIAEETGLARKTVEKMAHYSWEFDDFGAPISSGSFRTDGMVVLPCSIKSLSAIAQSYNDSLLVRAADVTLKQRRMLILGVRETPFHHGHLSLMLRAERSGAIIAPPIPSFYGKPSTLEQLVDHYVCMVLDLLGIDSPLYRRWREPHEEPRVHRTTSRRTERLA